MIEIKCAYNFVIFSQLLVNLFVVKMVDIASANFSRLPRQSSLPTYEEAVRKYTTDSSTNINRFLVTVPVTQNFTEIQNPPVRANTQVNSGEVRSGYYRRTNTENSGIYEVK